MKYIARGIHSRLSQRFVLRRASLFALTIFAVAIRLVYGQTAPDDGTKIASDIAKVQSGDFALVTLEDISEANATQSIPALEQQFPLTKDDLTKGKLAEVLVRLGDKDPVYWSFLVQQAQPAVESDRPSPVAFDSDGKFIRNQWSPEFIAWAKARNLAVSDAGQDAVYWLPVRLLLLAATDDRRAIPILRQGLRSRNYFISSAAALGLAEYRDKDSIPLIVRECQNRPAEAAATIARNLAFFDDPAAQSAVDKYVPPESAKVLREDIAKGRGPFHRTAPTSHK